MSLNFSRFVELPQNVNKGGFDHASFSSRLGRIYVAHTANNTLDVIDINVDQYLRSITGLKGIAGALVSDEKFFLFTSNRGENTVSIFNLNTEELIHKVNVGMPDDQSSYSLSVINVDEGVVIATIPTPGRSRWICF